MEYDFSGWATKNNLKCSDGRTIMKDAFSEQNGMKVPLVWNHQHDSVYNVLGHAVLENRPEGVYAYCKFNNTESGQQAKDMVCNGDVDSLSIWANKLKENNKNVYHGIIREVSLVLAGANPKAKIDYVLSHGDDGSDELGFYFYNDDPIEFPSNNTELEHSDADKKSENADNSKEHSDTDKKSENANDSKEEKAMAEEKKSMEDVNVKEVIDSMTEIQKKVLYGLVGAALQDAQNNEDYEEEKDVKHNVFDNTESMTGDAVLSHADQETIIKEGKKCGSLREAVLAHTATYGIDQIDWLFPDYKNVTEGAPSFINVQPQEWVKDVMSNIHHTPFSRIKSMFADIREDEARARGYIKGRKKKEEVFTLLKRTTDPQTVYKLQKFDRDDVIDITDFDVISWVKGEMRMKLDEELARAFLFGDGRLSSSDDKIQETHIRPIVSDDSLYTIEATVTQEGGEKLAHAIIRTLVTKFSDYQGSGTPTLYTSSAVISQLLLLEDGVGRRLYNSISDVATAMLVKKIVAVPASYLPAGVYGLVVNLADYNVGADKGGSVNMFEDFDIDYNQQKYLIETRCSGALIKPFSAIVLKAADEEPTPEPEENDNENPVG